MCQPGRWWIGLAPLAVIWIALNFFKIDQIERDVSARADAAVAREGGEAGQSTALGRDVRLAGLVFDPATRPAVLVAAAVAPGVRRVEDGLSAPAAAKPYLWSATLADSALVLSGAVDSPASRSAIATAAKKALPQATVADRMVYASGAPADFAAKATAALKPLAFLASGRAELRDAGLTVTGQAKSASAFDAATAAVRALPDGMILAKADITPSTPAVSRDSPPTLLKAEKTVSALTLSGVYPDDDSRGSLLARAREKFPDLKIIDHLQAGAGATKSILRASLEGLEQLSRLQTGSFVLRDRTALLSGDAGGSDVAEDVKTAFIAAMPGGFGLETHLTGAAREASEKPASPPVPAPALAPEPVLIPPVAKVAAAPVPDLAEKTAAATPSPQSAELDGKACQAQLMAILARTPILFDTASARLKQQDVAVIDSLAAQARQCAPVAFEVSGHTDDVDKSGKNQDLSLRRAQNVQRALIGAGIDAGRLTAAGYGSTKPLASNATEDGRAKNRRIEFNMK